MHFNKELVMTNEDDENFENTTKYWICDNSFLESDVKVRDQNYATGKHQYQYQPNLHLISI